MKNSLRLPEDQTFARVWPSVEASVRATQRRPALSCADPTPATYRNIAEKLAKLTTGEGVTVHSVTRPDGYINQAAAISGGYYAATKLSPTAWHVRRMA